MMCWPGLRTMPPRDGGIVSSGEGVVAKRSQKSRRAPSPKDRKDHGRGLAFQGFKGCSHRKFTVDLLDLLGEGMAAPVPPFGYSLSPSSRCTMWYIREPSIRI